MYLLLHSNGEVIIFHLEFLDLGMDEVLDGEGPWPQDVAAGDVVVLHLGFDERLAVPVWEVS